jgi:hypothetical protein
MGTGAFLLGNACLPYAFQSTINLDGTLLDKARFLTSTKERAALVRQALETFYASNRETASLRWEVPCPMRRQLRAAGALMVIAEKTINVYIIPPGKAPSTINSNTAGAWD